MNWETAMTYCVETFGVQADLEDRFFICPECGEPIYEEDWEGYNSSSKSMNAELANRYRKVGFTVTEYVSPFYEIKIEW